jgi:hypothetical protein
MEQIVEAVDAAIVEDEDISATYVDVLWNGEKSILV